MTTNRLITVAGFLDQFQRQHLHRQEKPFCFVLGAGASRMSKIPTGGEMALDWLRHIHRERDFSGSTLETWATPENLGIPGFELKSIATFYSHLYDVRFADSPESGYAYLEDVMRDKEPSFGYSVLAYLLSATRHKIVITTNFDNLVADALSIHSTTFPIVVGHDSLSHYARVELRRPLIAKVHGGLGFAPKSALGELSSLADGWSKALAHIFERCSPIVIGYDGNDGSLMQLLESMPDHSIDGLRWCFHATEDSIDEAVKRVPPRVIELVERKRGRLVPIPGFDEIMLLIQQHMQPVLNMPNLLEGMKQRARLREESYEKQEAELSERVRNTGHPSMPLPPSISANAESPPDVASMLKEAVIKLAGTHRTKPWWLWDREARAAGSVDEKDCIYQDAIIALPSSAELLGNYANFLRTDRKEMDKAEVYYARAINADPRSANNLGNYASFLEIERKEMDKAESFYLRAIDAGPKNAYHLGNYALFLQAKRKEMDKAESFYLRAIDADPKDADNLGNYSLFLKKERKEMDKAESYYRRAIDADPNHANHLGNYANFLHFERKDMDRAENFYLRAIEADPHHANHLGNYANFLQAQRKEMDKAENFYLRAIDADPNHAANLGNYANFLQAERKEMDKAENFYLRAIDADPNHAANLANYANFLHGERKEMDKAQNFYLRAIDADPKHAGTLGSYANFLQAERKEVDKAENFYLRAIDADPQNACNLGNYAQHCLTLTRIAEGLEWVTKAEALRPKKSDILSELVFYRLAHDPQAWPHQLSQMAQLLNSGARSLGWDLESNVAVAEASGHPNVKLLRAIAGVISRNEPVEGLFAHSEWPREDSTLPVGIKHAP